MKTAVVALLWTIGAVTIIGGSLASTAPSPTNTRQSKEEPPVVCGLRNTAYAGLCEERTPYVKGKELNAICKPILDCLNDTQCIKTYCGATTVRSGWILESAKRAK
jgi:hypothetical protein